jgi:hypothetical protein
VLLLGHLQQLRIRIVKPIKVDGWSRSRERVISKFENGVGVPYRKQSIADAKRDRVIADAVKHALYAMRLVNGKVMDGGVSILQFEQEMAKLEKALKILNDDRDSDASKRFAN